MTIENVNANNIPLWLLILQADYISILNVYVQERLFCIILNLSYA